MSKGIAHSYFTVQRGVSLIEVLVALLVFGVGVVGFAALQLKSVKQVDETYSRSQAMAVAQDLIERVKVNNFDDQAVAYYLAASSWTNDNNNPPNCVVTDSLPSAANGCSPIQLAQFDVSQVRSQLTNLLTNGSILFGACEEVFCVTVAWADTQADSCDQTAFANGERQSDAHCVQVEFIP